MPVSFEGHGFRFLYPENWKLEEQASENGGSVTLQSPGTGFMFVTFDRNRPAVEDVLETTLAALRDDYPELETEAVTEKIANRQARGYDVQFFSLDLVNNCWIRAFRTSRQTVLIMCQVTDWEVEETEPVFRAIRASMETVE